MADRRSRPRAGLTREKVLDAALALVDAHGLPALSMRKLGAELGVEGMTLYHYFPNKTALLDSMVERVFGLAMSDPPPEPDGQPTDGRPIHGQPIDQQPTNGQPRDGQPRDGQPTGGHWTDWLHWFARSTRATLLRHPGVLTLVATRPVSTPEALRLVELALSRLRSAGLPLDRSMDVINAVATFVIGHTLAEVGQTPGHEGTEPDLDRRPAALDPAEFPNFSEVLATRAGLDFDRRFETTLRILLRGYAELP